MDERNNTGSQKGILKHFSDPWGHEDFPLELPFPLAEHIPGVSAVQKGLLTIKFLINSFPLHRGVFNFLFLRQIYVLVGRGKGTRQMQTMRTPQSLVRRRREGETGEREKSYLAVVGATKRYIL